MTDPYAMIERALEAEENWCLILYNDGSIGLHEYNERVKEAQRIAREDLLEIEGDW